MCTGSHSLSLSLFLSLCVHIYIYIRHRAARHARACSRQSSGGLILSLVCLFVKGPQPVTRVRRTPFFEPFFGSLFFMAFWSQMASHLGPKIAQNPEKSCSRGLPESTLKKVTKNDAIWVPSRPQKSRFRTVGVAKIKK